MAKSMIFTPAKLEKIKPKSGLQRRRNSTGGAATIFSQPNPIPNYLRASIGSCHDLCKYGIRRDSPPAEESGSTEQQRRNRNMKPRLKYKGKKVPETKTLVLSSSRLQQPKETSKSTCNARASRNDEVKKRSSLPRTTSPLPETSAKIPPSKNRRRKTVPNKAPKSEPTKLLESSKITECETVAETIVHAVEAHDGNQNEDLDLNRDQKQEMDSAANSLSPELKREEIVERENKEEDGWKERRLRRVVSEGDFDHKQKECMRLVVMSKSKVKALVDTFETLISTQDYDGSRSCSSSA